MADNSITIDPASIFDNPTDRRVEFRGEVDGETYAFGVNHSVIEALTGSVPDAPATAFAAVSGEVGRAALVALARANGDDLVVVSENDLAQTPQDGAGPQAGPDADGFPAEPRSAEAEAHPS